ncbi:DUF2593 family protein [Salmonella enterica subsp. enterica]|nr:DUF2593 family protein [Salmonella enterica subsp. enterica]
MLVFAEIYCAFSLVKGRSWARWVYRRQIIVSGYLWAASLATDIRSCLASRENRSVISRIPRSCKTPDLNLCSSFRLSRPSRRFFRPQIMHNRRPG